MKLNTMNKTQMLAIFAGLCMIASTQAQPDQSRNQSNVAAPAPSAELPTFTIDFPGGTPGDLVEQMAKATGSRPNMIIPAYVADVQIPKFKLQNVTVSQVFDAMNMVADDKGSLNLRWISEGAKGDNNRNWTLAKAPGKPKVETCQVTFIGNLLDSFQLDDINAAIRTAWEMLGKSSTPSLKFHKETRLLIAKGSEEELKLVFDVLKSLDQAAAVKRQAELKK
jgi:hypothetical protein